MKIKNVGFKEDLTGVVDSEDGLLKQRKYSPALKNENITHSTPEIGARQATQNVAVVGRCGSGASSFIYRMLRPHDRGHDLSLNNGSDARAASPKLQKRHATRVVIFSNAKLYKCTDPSIPRPECYRCYPSHSQDLIEEEHLQYSMLKHVAFLDFPSHCNFVSSILTGSTIVDAVILVVAADEHLSHEIPLLLTAIKKANISQLIILQNKVDNVGREQAMDNHQEITNLLQRDEYSFAAKCPIVPISVKKDKNVDVVIDLLCTYVKPQERDYTLPPRMLILRSFDPNPENCGIEDLKGGCVGGQIMQGVFRVGQKIEVRPGVLYKRSSKEKIIECLPLKTKIVDMFSEKNVLQVGIPGGMVGMCTKMDPAVCSRNKLVGQIVGKPGTLPEIWRELLLDVDLFPAAIRSDSQEGDPPEPIQQGERLLLNIGGISSVGTVVQVTEDGNIVYNSKAPICVSEGDTVSISRMISGKHGESLWSLIGMANVKEGVKKVPFYDRSTRQRKSSTPEFKAQRKQIQMRPASPGKPTPV